MQIFCYRLFQVLSIHPDPSQGLNSGKDLGSILVDQKPQLVADEPFTFCDIFRVAGICIEPNSLEGCDKSHPLRINEKDLGRQIWKSANRFHLPSSVNIQ